MQKLYASLSRADIDLLASILESEGLEFEVRNEYTSANVPGAAFFPELWVLHDEDVPKAVELRDAWRAERPPARDGWSCPGCGERLEAQFDSCWKCGVSRP